MNGKILVAMFFVGLLSAGALSCGSGNGDETEAVCTPQEKECDGSDVVKCNAAGTDWDLYKECPNGCEAGACKGEETCTPACGTKTCGDDGCGGACGTCGTGQTCDAAGKCQAEACQAQCAGKDCGDDGCGGECGTCPLAAPNCDKGVCVSDCVPNCTGKECDGDGCGGTCGDCPAAAPVCQEGTCVAQCQPDCTGKQCGSNGCGGDCGACAASEQCVGGKCECLPNCVQKVCGADGCGGTCGSCSGNEECQSGDCVCKPSCSGKECGNDGCGGSCGVCSGGQECSSGTCVSGYTCDEYFGCADACGDDQACIDACWAETDNTATAQAALFVDCYYEYCADEEENPAYALCMEENCIFEYLNCFGVECAEHTDCTNEAPFCYMGVCSVAYGRTYYVTFYSAEITQTDPNTGAAWDSFGGMPDPYVAFKFGSTSGSTGTVEDSLSPTWNEYVVTPLLEQQEVSVTVYDEDWDDDDWIGGINFSAGAVPLEWILDGYYYWVPGDPSYGLQGLYITIEP